MRFLLFTAGMIVLLVSPVVAQTGDDPVGQWLFQIEQQIRQDPVSSERLIRRLGAMRDPDLLERLQSRWSELSLDKMSLAQRNALFDLEFWLAFQTGTYNKLPSRLQNNGLAEARPERWLELGNQLSNVGAYEQARIAWRELAQSPLAVLRCRALTGLAHSHVQEGIERLNQANPTFPSPLDSFRQAVNHLQSLLQEIDCRQDLESSIVSLLKVAPYYPSASRLLDGMDRTIPSNDPIRQSTSWTRLRYYQSVMERSYPEARHWIGRLLEHSSDDVTGTLRWKLALLEWAEGEPDMAQVQLNALRQISESDSFNDLTTDLYLKKRMTSSDATWYPQFMLYPSIPPDSLAKHIEAPLSNLSPRVAGLLLYRLHQRSGHRYSTPLTNDIRMVLDRIDTSDPLVPHLQWALLQHKAWQLAHGKVPGQGIDSFRQHVRKFLDAYPSHPAHEAAQTTLEAL